jgi:hypothetical protein
MSPFTLEGRGASGAPLLDYDVGRGSYYRGSVASEHPQDRV